MSTHEKINAAPPPGTHICDAIMAFMQGITQVLGAAVFLAKRVEGDGTTTAVAVAAGNRVLSFEVCKSVHLMTAAYCIKFEAVSGSIWDASKWVWVWRVTDIHWTTMQQSGEDEQELPNNVSVRKASGDAIVGLRRAFCLAFAMGGHARLGNASRCADMDIHVISMILKELLPRSLNHAL